STTLARTTAPFPPSPGIIISSLTAAAIASLSFTSGNRIAAPTPSASTTAFILCSANSGHASIGTPCTRLSSAEFHPQCVRNPPVASWPSTSVCGAHKGTTRPTSLVLSTKPSGRYAKGSFLLAASEPASSSLGRLRTTHRNRCPLSSSPSASSRICSAGRAPPEPNETKTTDAAGCRSSHSRHQGRTYWAAKKKKLILLHCIYAALAAGRLHSTNDRSPDTDRERATLTARPPSLLRSPPIRRPPPAGAQRAGSRRPDPFLPLPAASKAAKHKQQPESGTPKDSYIMKRDGDIASLFRKHAAKKLAVATSCVPPIPTAPIVEENTQGQEEDTAVEEVENPTPTPTLTEYVLPPQPPPRRLRYSLRCLRFLLHQRLSFRGHDESEESSNRGNFIELLKFLAVNSEEVDRYVLRHAPGNCLLTSPKIQKQIIECCALETRKKIIEELGEEYYAILADESSDISHKEQLAFCLRFVDRLGKPCEHFIGVVHVDDTTSLSLKKAIESKLVSYGLTMTQIRGQGYDGASNMKGEIRGLKTLIMQVSPSAYYIHCFAHQLQLVLVAVAKGNSDCVWSATGLENELHDASASRNRKIDSLVSLLMLGLSCFEETPTNRMLTGKGIVVSGFQRTAWDGVEIHTADHSFSAEVA
ncbi:hypothetical protein U9M48_002324, partial [Paspalum notatum var. saurae]